MLLGTTKSKKSKTPHFLVVEIIHDQLYLRRRSQFKIKLLFNDVMMKGCCGSNKKQTSKTKAKEHETPCCSHIPFVAIKKNKKNKLGVPHPLRDHKSLNL
jgi:hypothetical protein